MTEKAVKPIGTVATFTIGSVLGRSFSLLSSRTGIFLALAFFSLLPGAVFRAYGFDRTGLAFFLINLFTGMLVLGSGVCAAFRIMTGGTTVSFGEAVSKGVARLLPLLGTVFLLLLGVALSLFLSCAVCAAFFAIFDVTLGLGAFATVLKPLCAAFLAIPALILLCIWSLFVPCCVVEHLDPVQSLSRSAQLTKGYRVRIFVIDFLSILLTQIAARFAVQLAAMFFPASPFLFSSVFLITLLLPRAYAPIVLATTYYDLRTIKEVAGSIARTPLHIKTGPPGKICPGGPCRIDVSISYGLTGSMSFFPLCTMRKRLEPSTSLTR